MLDLYEFEKAAKNAGFFSLDTETTGLDTRVARLICITLAVGDKAWIVPLTSFSEVVSLVEAKDWLNQHIFNDPNLTVIIHNAKYDLSILEHHGFEVQNKVVDTMVCEWLTNEYGAADPAKNEHPHFGLKELVWKYFHIKRDKYKTIEDLLFIDPKGFVKYAMDDALDAWRLWHEIETPALKREGSGVRNLFYGVEMPLIFSLMEMEESGLYVNIEKMGGLLKQNAEEVKGLTEKIYKLAGKQFNIASSDQLSGVLFKELKIDATNIPLHKKSVPGSPIYSTAEKVLKHIRHSNKIIPLIEAYRKTTKMRDGFLTPLLEKSRLSDECRIYPEFNQTGTKIGRLSSSNPNAQQLPREGGIRDCISAPHGCVLCCSDYSQAEYRVLAHQSNDQSLIKLYNSDPKADIHKWVAQEASIERDDAKAVGFGLLYGLADPSLAASLKVSLAKAQELRAKWTDLCKGVLPYKKKVEYDLIRNKFVETIWGRRRRFFGVRLDDFAHRQAFHMTISGSAADAIKIGTNKLYKAIQELRTQDPRYKQVRMLAQVHDELVLQCPEEIKSDVIKLVKEKMEDVGQGHLRVPFVAKVGCGPTWSDAKG